MMRIVLPRSACATTSVLPSLDRPIVTYRRSPREWAGSGYVVDKGSSRTLAASRNPTACFRRLTASFSGFQVNVMHQGVSVTALRPSGLTLKLSRRDRRRRARSA